MSPLQDVQGESLDGCRRGCNGDTWQCAALRSEVGGSVGLRYGGLEPAGRLGSGLGDGYWGCKMGEKGFNVQRLRFHRLCPVVWVFVSIYTMSMSHIAVHTV